jgi:adenosylcobalamin-dependent ribonucleoside-triphosphate reductase
MTAVSSPAITGTTSEDRGTESKRAGVVDAALARRFLDSDDNAGALLPEPGWGPNGKVVFDRTYSRVTADGSRETWAQTCRRVVLGNLAYAPESTWLPDEALDLFRAMYGFGGLPGGRHISATGSSITATRNCFAAGFEQRTGEHAAWTGKVLFLGGGVGSNYSSDLTAVCEPVRSRVRVLISCREDHPDYAEVRDQAGETMHPAASPAPGSHETVRVADTREGWCDAWGHLIDKATRPGDATIVFDVSGVRPKGSELKTMGGTASGPGPLARSLASIAAVLGDVRGRRLTGLEHMLIDHEVASAVVAGGTRRSARLALMNWRDEEVLGFIGAKQPGEDGSMPHWTANLSVETDSEFAEALDDPGHELHGHAARVLAAISEGMARNGEPGIVNTSAHSEGEPVRIRHVNPCGETSLQPWESCLVGSLNLDRYGRDLAGALHGTRLLARFLYRATLEPFPDGKAAAVEARNRRLGLGVLGLHGWVMAHGVKLTDFPAHAGLRARLSAIRTVARAAADELADELGLPRPVKVLAVAPTGTISTLPGATPGVSPVIYKRFIRRVRFADSDPQLPVLERQGYVIEDDRYAAHTKVVSFPTQDAILDRFPPHLVEDSTEISFSQYMAVVQAVQDTLLEGRDGNAVSATAQIPAGTDPAELADALRPYLRGSLKGITVFPEVSMAQSPFSPLTEDEYEEARSELAESARFHAALGDSNDGSACASGACPVV